MTLAKLTLTLTLTLILILILTLTLTLTLTLILVVHRATSARMGKSGLTSSTRVSYLLHHTSPTESRFCTTANQLIWNQMQRSVPPGMRRCTSPTT